MDQDKFTFFVVAFLLLCICAKPLMRKARGLDGYPRNVCPKGTITIDLSTLLEIKTATIAIVLVIIGAIFGIYSGGLIGFFSLILCFLIQLTPIIYVVFVKKPFPLFSIKRRQLVTFAQKLLKADPKTQATVEGVSKRTWKDVKLLPTFSIPGSVSQDSAFGYDNIDYSSTLITYTFADASGHSITRNIFFIVPTLLTYKVWEMKHRIDSGKAIDIPTLWKQLDALKEGDTLSVVYKPDEPTVNYPEAYLQALAALKG